MDKLRLGIVYGGRSGEHEVSKVSAANVLAALDRDRFEVVEIFIDPRGAWYVGGSRAWLRLDTEGKAVFCAGGGEVVCDVMFPVLHGPYGEDGTIQGLFEMVNVPYVGAGVLGSAMGMDKEVQKKVLRAAGLPVVDFVAFSDREWASDPAAVREAIVGGLGFPVFTKPARLGSSVGIRMVMHVGALDAAVADALQYDTKVVVERAVPAPLEIEVSVLGNDEPQASLPGEIRPAHEFYDYEAKYVDPDGAELLIPSSLDAPRAEEVRRLALRAYRVLGLEGMARVDFLAERDGPAYVSEVNTIPGFTQISMYPKLWEASGLPYRELLSRLVDLALERWRRRNALKTSYEGGRRLHRAAGGDS
ncbi:MAG: D-alanine--D-alanine ligase family protein [Armatimonadota bacterium]|nr:D-alanine--D-alanine ligase family protein [Armatimonadota bacterium]MDR5696297.1 D-alanine--D-alanine ligase family protein [Armatimonadota bacterium]